MPLDRQSGGFAIALGDPNPSPHLLLEHAEETIALLREKGMRAEAEVERLREAIHAHRVARRYNPRAAWVDARLWDTTGEEV